jgi:TrmH family RNA methyltransferase
MASARITSRSNPLIRDLARLTKRRERRLRSLFLVEGEREVGRAVAAGVEIVRLVVAPDLRADAGLGDALAIPTGAIVTEVGPAAFGALSRRQHPDGLLAVARTPDRSIGRLETPDRPLLLVAEHIEKPGNLGAMFRTADGAGADAVLVADPLADLENPNVIRASQGSVFAVRSAVAGTAEVVGWLAGRGVRLVTLTPDAAVPLWEVDLTGAVAIAIGSEDRGLSPQLAAAGRAARLPMRGAADSLNASVAAAVALYEAVRQRR